MHLYFDLFVFILKVQQIEIYNFDNSNAYCPKLFLTLGYRRSTIRITCGREATERQNAESESEMTKASAVKFLEFLHINVATK